jgi:hypothetical protein
LLDVAGGECASLTVEPFGRDALGIEFIVDRHDGRRDFHSVKRQHSKEWSLAALTRAADNGRSVLADLFGKLSTDDRSACWFVSATGANDLRELAERARGRRTLADFQHEVTHEVAETIRRSFEKHILSVAGDWQTAHCHLQRLRVVLIDEETLKAQLEQRIALLVYRPDGGSFLPSDIRLLLGEFITERLGTKILREDVWDRLRSHGYGHRDWATDKTVHEIVRDNNQAYARAVELELVNSSRIARAEVRTILEEIAHENGARTALVSAPAGVGKSCVMAQLVHELDTRGIPVLAVRMDRHGDAHSPRDIGVRMRLPQSPAVVLAGIANGRDSVLVIDQLDAVSQTSGRYPHLWEVFDSLRREVAVYSNMRVVIVCRDFDLQNDPRLRRLNDPKSVKHVQVQLLSIDEVDAALTAAGVSAQLAPKQKEVLRTPLHLFLFLDCAAEDTAFQGIGDLFERYWRRKQKAVSTRLGAGADWSGVIDKLCETMSQEQRLYVHEADLDNWRDIADAMLTEHVLVLDEGQVRFFHESFFDFAFARRFCVKGGELIHLLHSAEQHLFRRGQVRQVLTFLRQQWRKEYPSQLRKLLTDGKVRYHLKRLVFAWMGALPDPSDEEWKIVESVLEVKEYQNHLLFAIRNNLAWFDLLHRLGILAGWLHSSTDELVNRAVWFLLFDRVQKERSEVAAELLAAFRGHPAWTDRFRGYFEFGNTHQSAAIRQLFLQLMADGVFEETGYGSWWHMLGDAAKNAPLFALEAVTSWLDRMIDTMPSAAAKHALDPKDQRAEQLIAEIARKDSTAYLGAMLPRVVKISTLCEEPFKGRLRHDAIWGFPSNREPIGLADTLLNELTTALEKTAKESPQRIEAVTDGSSTTESMTITVLLLRAWSANPSYFGDRCVRFLADPCRLNIGYSPGLDNGNGAAAVSREAIRACLPYATTDSQERLERVIIGIHLQGEEGECEGWTERLLLESFGEHKLSADGQARLNALRCKFPQQDTGIPRRGVPWFTCVGSPIPPDETRHFSDDQWLAAMRQYDYGWDCPTRDLKGTAVELSRVLEQEARRDRRRFAALVQRMENEIRPEYFDAVLDGICGMGNLSKEERQADDVEFGLLDTETVLAVIRRLHALPTRPCGRSICRAFERIAGRSIPEPDLRTLAYYALEDTDPRSDDRLTHNSASGKEPSENAHFYGYNSVRGGAARAIGRLLFEDYSHSTVLLPLVRRMVKDPSMAVRTCVAEALLPMFNHDRDDAVRLFLEACQEAEAIWGSYPIENFIRYASSTHYAQLRDLLQRVLRCHSEEAVRMAARQVCLAALTDGTADADAESVRTGTEVMRCAAAEIYAYNLGNATVGATCREHLPALFADHAEKVRNEAASCFGHLKDVDFGAFADLIRVYVESPAYPSPHDHLLRHLEDSTWQLPEISIRLAERFIATCGTQAGNFATAAAGDAQSVSRIVVRLYAQTTSETIQAKCLDLIDQMEQLNFYGIDSELAEHDR